MKKNLLIAAVSTFILLSGCSDVYIKDEFKASLNYYNRKYHFKINFPESWINYSTFEIDEIIDPDLKVKTICFALPTRSADWQPVNIPVGYATLFSVRIFTGQQWALFIMKYGEIKTEINSADRKIGQSQNSVYMIKNSTAIPVDLYLYMKDIASITETFRVIVPQ